MKLNRRTEIRNKAKVKNLTDKDYEQLFYKEKPYSTKNWSSVCLLLTPPNIPPIKKRAIYILKTASSQVFFIDSLMFSISKLYGINTSFFQTFMRPQVVVPP